MQVTDPQSSLPVKLDRCDCIHAYIHIHKTHDLSELIFNDTGW